MERCQLLLGLQVQDFSVPGMCQAKDTGWHSCPSRHVGILIPLHQATGFREWNFVCSHTIGGQIRVLSWNCFLGFFYAHLSLLACFDENSKANKCWERCRVKGTLIVENINQHMEKKRQRFIKISSLELAYDPEIPLLGRQRRNKIDMLKTCLLPPCSCKRVQPHKVFTNWRIGKEEIKNECVQKRTHRG